MSGKARTDLASEQWESLGAGSGELSGVRSENELLRGFNVTTVDILDRQGAEMLCKPIGKYITVDLTALLKRKENSFCEAAMLLSELLQRLLPQRGERPVLVAGLGNADITPDAIGPETADHVLATRHLKETMPADFESFSAVACLKTGVLGMTGIESASVLKAVCGEVAPACVIAVDALAAADMEKLCRTVQLSDAGIVPGSGVGNDRAELSAGTLGAPVISIGVPTVVDAAMFTEDEAASGMFVTTRDIDSAVRDSSKLVGYAINLALHPGITIEDIDMFLS